MYTALRETGTYIWLCLQLCDLERDTIKIIFDVQDVLKTLKPLALCKSSSVSFVPRSVFPTPVVAQHKLSHQRHMFNEPPAYPCARPPSVLLVEHSSSIKSWESDSISQTAASSSIRPEEPLITTMPTCGRRIPASTRKIRGVCLLHPREGVMLPFKFRSRPRTCRQGVRGRCVYFQCDCSGE